MAAAAGYWQDKGTGIGGGFEIRSVPYLKEVGLTPANGTFGIVGTGKEIKSWLSDHSDLKVTHNQDTGLTEFYVLFSELQSTNAGKVLMEAYATNLFTAGGLAGGVVDAVAGTVIGELVNKFAGKKCALKFSLSKPSVKCQSFSFQKEGVSLATVAKKIGLS